MFFLIDILKNENEFVTTANKLGYPILTKKVDQITAAAIWQESNISKKLERVISRHLSNCFSTRLLVPEY